MTIGEWVGWWLSATAFLGILGTIIVYEADGADEKTAAPRMRRFGAVMALSAPTGPVGVAALILVMLWLWVRTMYRAATGKPLNTRHS